VDVEKDGPQSHEVTGMEWHVSDNHQQTLSFSDVHPVDITVRGLNAEVDIAGSFVDALKAKITKSKVGDMEGDATGGVQRKILKDVSVSFPPRTLAAIIGGSGSGKVRLYPQAS
jgi:ABC-type multidrug transport system fused ATPase/permease subunit